VEKLVLISKRVTREVIHQDSDFHDYIYKNDTDSGKRPSRRIKIAEAGIELIVRLALAQIAATCRNDNEILELVKTAEVPLMNTQHFEPDPKKEEEDG
jgi:hypothetical protein